MFEKFEIFFSELKHGEISLIINTEYLLIDGVHSYYFVPVGIVLIFI